MSSPPETTALKAYQAFCDHIDNAQKSLEFLHAAAKDLNGNGSLDEHVSGLHQHLMALRKIECGVAWHTGVIEGKLERER